MHVGQPEDWMRMWVFFIFVSKGEFIMVNTDRISPFMYKNCGTDEIITID